MAKKVVITGLKGQDGGYLNSDLGDNQQSKPAQIRTLSATKRSQS